MKRSVLQVVSFGFMAGGISLLNECSPRGGCSDAVEWFGIILTIAGAIFFINVTSAHSNEHSSNPENGNEIHH
jgi:hypothetical protein